MGVLDEMRAEAVQPEAHVDLERRLHRGPLRRPAELRCDRGREGRVGLAPPPGERERHREGVTGGIRGIGLRPALLGEDERLIVAPQQRELRVRAIRTLDAGRVLHRPTYAPLARRGLAVEERVGDREQQTAQIAERALREREDAVRFAHRGRRRDERDLLLHHQEEERVAQIRRALLGPHPRARKVGILHARECAKRLFEGHGLSRASVTDRRSMTFSNA